MNANIGWQRILAYLKFLDGTLLIRLIEPHELRLKRRRGASKLCLCDPMLPRLGYKSSFRSTRPLSLLHLICMISPDISPKASSAISSDP